MAFYGSQTGTAEEFAGRLAKEGIRYQLKGMVADPEEYDMVSINHSGSRCRGGYWGRIAASVRRGGEY